MSDGSIVAADSVSGLGSSVLGTLGPLAAFAAVGATTASLISDIGAIAEGSQTKLSNFTAAALAIPTGGLSFLDFGGISDLFGGGREDPFRDARNQLAGFIDELQETTGFDLSFDFVVDGFSEITLGLKELRAELDGIIPIGFAEDFVTPLEDGQLAINEFSLELLRLGEDTVNLLPTFEGIGTTIAASFGLAGEELAAFGQQFGILLGVNLQDELGLNELQLLFQQAGLSAEEFGKALEDAFFRGDITAREFLNAQQSTEDLFAQGIPGAVGATDAAFANLVTGGLESGQRAMDAFGDLAAEAIEKGITSLDELRADLIASGANADEVAKLFEGLSAAGIETIEQLAQIDLPQAAQLITNLEDIGFGFQTMGEEIEHARELLQRFREETSRPIVQQVEVNYRITGDKEAIDAGLTNSLIDDSGVITWTGQQPEAA